MSVKFNPQMNNGVREISVQETHELGNNVRLIDVRMPDEFVGDLGHIAGAELIVLGPDLLKFLENGNRDENIIFVCKSGGRSGQATFASQNMGYKNTANMIGGMMAWNQFKLPITKD